MKIIKPILTVMVVAAIGVFTSNAHAQQVASGCSGSCGDTALGGCGTRPGVPCPQATNGVGVEGYCIGCPNGERYLSPRDTMELAMRDKYSPRRIYSYSPAGLDATRMHHWNYQQASVNPWHGTYNYWRYGQPMALVVPPTAAFQTEYNWGVGQTKSFPIYHQYHRTGTQGISVMGSNGVMTNGFSNTPYWPSSTRQFGVYPVRGPW